MQEAMDRPFLAHEEVECLEVDDDLSCDKRREREPRRTDRLEEEAGSEVKGCERQVSGFSSLANGFAVERRGPLLGTATTAIVDARRLAGR